MRFRVSHNWLVMLSVGLLALAMLPPQVARADDCLSGPNVPGCKFGLPEGQYDALLGQMNANPTPNTTTIAVNRTEIHRFSFFTWRSKDVTFYNAPNGSPVGKIDPGFSYVQIIDSSGDWAEV